MKLKLCWVLKIRVAAFSPVITPDQVSAVVLWALLLRPKLMWLKCTGLEAALHSMG